MRCSIRLNQGHHHIVYFKIISEGRSIFTNNINAGLKAARQLQYGETYINREHFEAMQGFHAGRRNSGIGGADGKHGLMEYVETHVTYIQTHD